MTNSISLVPTCLISVALLQGCESLQTHSTPAGDLRLSRLPDWDLMQSEDLHLGGFSGLHFEGKNDQGEWLFLTFTDRGPNAEIIPDPDGKTVRRPFVKPDFQPRWIRALCGELNLKTGSGTPGEGSADHFGDFEFKRRPSGVRLFP